MMSRRCYSLHTARKINQLSRLKYWFINNIRSIEIQYFFQYLELPVLFLKRFQPREICVLLEVYAYFLSSIRNIFTIICLGWIIMREGLEHRASFAVKLSTSFKGPDRSGSLRLWSGHTKTPSEKEISPWLRRLIGHALFGLASSWFLKHLSEKETVWSE